MFKKVLGLCLMMALLGVAGCAKTSDDVDAKNPSTQKEVVDVSVLVPQGSTALAMTGFNEKQEDYEHLNVTFEPYVNGSDPLVAAFTSESSNVIVAPTNLGASLYQKEVPYQLAATIGWGNLFIVANEALSVEDLKGQEIVAFGQGSTPDIVMRSILTELGLIDDVTITYLNSVADVQAMFAAGEAKIALVAEPALSVLKTKVDGVELVLDLQSEWESVYGVASYPQASVFVHDELASSDVGMASLLEAIEKSVVFANESTDELATIAAAYGIETPEPIIKQSIPTSNLEFKTAKEAKEAIQVYLEKLYEFEPKTVGGQLPDDAFYYINE